MSCFTEKDGVHHCRKKFSFVLTTLVRQIDIRSISDCTVHYCFDRGKLLVFNNTYFVCNERLAHFFAKMIKKGFARSVRCEEKTFCSRKSGLVREENMFCSTGILTDDINGA